MATNLENMENSGISKTGQNLRENSGKSQFLKKNLETQGKCKICGIIANKNLLQQIFSLELLREKF